MKQRQPTEGAAAVDSEVDSVPDSAAAADLADSDLVAAAAAVVLGFADFAAVDSVSAF